MNNFHEEVMNDFLAPRKDGKYELEIPCLTEGRKLVNRKDGFSWGVVNGYQDSTQSNPLEPRIW